MKVKIAFLGLMLLSLVSFAQHKIKPGKDLISFVNVFVGTDGPGNTYPGVALPFGMVQLSPDNGLGGWSRIAGYTWNDSTIAGFSHKHLTGTGAGDLYDILVMPLNSRFKEDLWPEVEDFRPYSFFNHAQEKAHPGYYSVVLQSSGIKAELTTTERVGFHRYTFPADDSSKILIDLGYSLNWDASVDTYIEILNDSTLAGYRFSTGWAKDQREYFWVKLSKPPVKAELFENNLKAGNKKAHSKKTKAQLYFNLSENETVLVKVALSSVSVDGARKNMQAELPGWDFDKCASDAENKWENQLGSIKVKGSKYEKEVFYTNLYHCFLTPSLHSDVDGFYKAPDSTTRQAVGFNRYETFSLWDTYRAAHPLYTLLCPDKAGDFIGSFIAHFNETGLLPVWSMAGNETDMMIGYHAVPVIVDAYFKNIKMDAEAAYNACKITAMSNAWDLEEYKKYGYVPSDGKSKGNWCVSKTLEYAFDDDCIAQFAKALHKTEDYQYFSDRAMNWKNLYDKSTGFFRPKDKAGEFLQGFNSKDYSDYYCESNAWHYLWSVQHQVDSLISALGEANFTAKLDSMFSYYPEPGDKLPIFSTGMIGQYAHGNEPSHHVAYLYNYVNQPWKSQKRIRQIMNTQYSNKTDGFCGNEDCGQMSAWYVWSALGFYPVNPQDGVYAFGSPAVKEALIRCPGGKTFRIVAHNNSAENIYIQSVKLNGIIYPKLSITHQQIIQGGKLEFFMGSKPSEKSLLNK